MLCRRFLSWILVLGLLAPGGVLLPAAGALAQEWQTHRVVRGENLTLIANRYDVTVQELRDWNDLRSDGLAIGQRLRIPVKGLEWYVVQPGDNLSTIADRFETTVEFLRSLNELTGSTLYPGQKLRLLPAPVDEAVHVVKRGDNLSGIADRHGVSIAHLRRINDLDGDRIFPGQKLRLREAAPSVHIVERGDALWEIAEAYGLSLDHLKAINGLTGDQIYPGQELRLNGDSAPRTATYLVQPGDNLNEIARLHQMSLRELRELNRISGSLIRPGQKLTVRPLLGSGAGSADVAGIPLPGGDLDWNALEVIVPGVAKLTPGNGPYYFSGPEADEQAGKSYFEKAGISPQVCYKRGRQLLERFDRTIELQPGLGRQLAGWTFVLDPGHGGIDPGTIVSGKDAEGQTYYVVEDEYVYDLALRVYALLKLHGADVEMTLLSPNHLLRGNTPHTQTFVHERNEVFNDQAWNRGYDEAIHPMGGQKYLDQRKAIARRALDGATSGRTVFLSFHADNDPDSGDVFTLFFFQNRRGADTVGRDFARRMLPAMGAGARTRGRNLGVLRENPARYALLVEMRNLAYAEHVWAIRYEQLRQRDAEKVVKAVIEAAAESDRLAGR